MLRRSLTLLIIFAFLISALPPLYAYSQMTEFLCEIGIKFYRQGRYEEAVTEFRKALMIQPDYAPALKYLQMIEHKGAEKEEEKGAVPVIYRPAELPIKDLISQSLGLIEIQREMIKEREAIKAGLITPLPLAPELKGREVVPERITPSVPILELRLDTSLSSVLSPIEIEQARTITLVGSNIQRFLVTQPDVLIAEKKSADVLSVTGNKIGYTYLYVWDDNGRWPLEFLTTLPRPEGPTLEEQMRLEEERAESFKLRYILDWNSYEWGRRLSTVERQSYGWYHNLSLDGATPYGNLDSRAIWRSLKKKTDLTYFTVGLSDGSWLNFKDFSLRAFDFTPGFSNLAFSSANLRGGMIKSPAFNQKIDYTAFWGREGGGRYGNLSPGLTKTRNSFLNGVDVNYYLSGNLNYGFSVLHGYGCDRPSHLNHYAYDANMNWLLGKWNMGFETAYDGETSSYLFNSNYKEPKLNFNYEFRDIYKDFFEIMGQTWRRGEIGNLFTLNYKPNDAWEMYNRLDIYRDRLFPSYEDDDRWNEDYDFNSYYNINPTTTLKLNYIFQNELGKISQLRYISPGIGLSKSFNLIRKISSYIDYRRQESKHYNARSLDYINDKISAGIRFSLIGQLYYFLSKQWDWLQERYTSKSYKPQVMETGLDLNSQIFDSPFYENIRFSYHDEEKTASTLSFLSGQDYIEGYAELSCRPGSGKELYFSTRVRNVWQENPATIKRIEVDFNAGLRYLWDTGIRWEGVGNIEGYVFRDLNSDGLRERDEAPVEGVKIWIGKKKSVTTDLFGYYKFKNIRGKKAHVAIDVQTLPAGFVLTVPQTQEAPLKQSRTSRIDFGIVSRSEISGFVFYDVNGNGEYDETDKGIKDVALLLEDGTKVCTDLSGRYLFRNAGIGKHTIRVDLKNLPLDYLPTVPITKEITLSEGVTYIYNIPLRGVKEE